MGRAWIWVQWLIGWLPVAALFAVLMMTVHGAGMHEALHYSLRLMATAAVLGLVVHRFTARLPWPHPMRLAFIARHAVGAALYALAWVAANSVVESLRVGQLVLVVGPGVAAYLVTGVWFYVMIAGVAYAQRAAARNAQLEALQARSQLAALRAQLHPHFLFNALHTVVQLIPLDPERATRAAEQLAALLRASFDNPRELVTLREEWAVVQLYLDIEAIRFGERLRVDAEFQPDALAATLPSFAVQTLIENAVRHGAAPRVEATTVRVRARVDGTQLRIVVEDDGMGTEPAALEAGGTGLRRLRERLGWLYGSGATLAVQAAPGQGLRAELRLPLQDDAEA
ncbi:MAG: histidine kinase [Burkholderiales bacterium]|jgi:signal transduction histidine kinase|nr:histidine kinase [Burkholderiales bacterium]